uniref:Uncharacterized protein n=1 Tax=Methylophaga nitratireducenticrescens TaxID=754476 RepID=I1XKE1_METNJ
MQFFLQPSFNLIIMTIKNVLSDEQNVRSERNERPVNNI